MSEGFQVSRLADDESVLLIELFDPAWNYYHQAIDQSLALIAQSDVPQYIILQSPPVLPKEQPLPHFRQTAMKWQQHPQLQAMVIVLPEKHTSSFFNSISQVLTRMILPHYVQKSFYVRTFEEALTRIRALRTQLSRMISQNLPSQA